MRIAVAREADPAEDRVAATPETVKKMKGLGADVAVEPGAGHQVRHSRCRLTRPPAPTVARDAVADADVVLKVRRPGALELAGYKKGALVIAIMDPYGNEAALKAMADAGVTAFAMELMPRITRAQVDGRAVEPGQSRRLPRGDRRRRRIRPRAADDDDGGRHRAGREGLHHGRRRRRPAGDRDRAPARRHRHRDRRAPGHQGAGREPGREIRRGRGRGVQAGRDRRRLRQGNVEGVPGQAGRARRRAHQEAGHRHHHRAHPGPAGAAADLRGDGRARCGRAR